MPEFQEEHTGAEGNSHPGGSCVSRLERQAQTLRTEGAEDTSTLLDGHWNALGWAGVAGEWRAEGSRRWAMKQHHLGQEWEAGGDSHAKRDGGKDISTGGEESTANRDGHLGARGKELGTAEDNSCRASGGHYVIRRMGLGTHCSSRGRGDEEGVYFRLRCKHHLTEKMCGRVWIHGLTVRKSGLISENWLALCVLTGILWGRSGHG